MADTYTTLLALTKPEPNSSLNTWGSKLNADMDSIDGLLQVATDAATPALKILYGGTAATTAAGARSSLGLANAVTAAGTLTADAPMIGAGSKAAAVGSRSGNTTEFGTIAGSKTVDKQLTFDSNGNIVASGSDIGGGGGGSSSWSAQATSFTATAGLQYFITGNNVTVTLPSAPADGATVTIASGAAVTGCQVARNGKNIMTLAEDLTIDTAEFSFRLVYRSATNDWRLV